MPPLPPAWAAGFPQLKQLRLAGLGLGGPLPAAWQSGGTFPLLTML